MTKPQPTDMDREDIKAAIRKTGVTMNDLARRNRYSLSAVRMVLQRPSPKVEALVAKCIGKRPQDIWPSRYDNDGNPLSGLHRTRRDTNRRSAATHRQKQEAV